MPVYQVGIDISVAKTTTVLVRLEAENKEEAYEKAWDKVRKLSLDRKDSAKLLRRIKSDCWDESFPDFEIEGYSNDSFPVEHYEADLDFT